jgi:hypothetical protein
MTGNEENNSSCDNSDASVGTRSRGSNGDGVSLKRKSPQDYSYQDLEPFFHLPIVDAARELKVCQTFLKKICRMNNIKRWPYRKLKSTNQLIHCQTEEELRIRQQQIVVTTEKSMALTDEELELIQEELAILEQQQQQQQQQQPPAEAPHPAARPITYLYKSKYPGEIPFFASFHFSPNSLMAINQTDALRIGRTHANFILYETDDLSHANFLGPVRLAAIDSIPSSSRDVIPVFEPDLLYSSTSHFVPYSLLGGPPTNLSSPTAFLSSLTSASSSFTSFSMPILERQQHSPHFSAAVSGSISADARATNSSVALDPNSPTGDRSFSTFPFQSHREQQHFSLSEQPSLSGPHSPFSIPYSTQQPHPQETQTTSLPPKKTRRMSPLFVTDSEQQDNALSQGMSTLLEPPSPFPSLDSLFSSSYDEAAAIAPFPSRSVERS